MYSRFSEGCVELPIGTSGLCPAPYWPQREDADLNALIKAASSSFHPFRYRVTNQQYYTIISADETGGATTMSLAARRLLSKRSVTHAELPERQTRSLETKQADAGSNLDSDTNLRDAADLEGNRDSSSHGLTNEGDAGSPMVIDSDEDVPSVNQESHTEATPRPKTRGKVVCQTCTKTNDLTTDNVRHFADMALLLCRPTT
jgi:hypothetical protein